jgi:hypothetical protein
MFSLCRITMNSHYYVYRVGHKGPTIKHESLTSAAHEAERLSAQHPGEVFEILQCLGMTRTVTPQTFWMDGVTPPPSFQESSGENTSSANT